MQLPIEWLPATGEPEQLIVLLHGLGSHGAALAPLAQALRAEFPQAAVLAPDAPHAWDGAAAGTGVNAGAGHRNGDVDVDVDGSSDGDGGSDGHRNTHAHAHATSGNPAPAPAGMPGAQARQWFSAAGLTDFSRASRVADALPALHAWLRHTQHRLHVPPAATALGGFSQGAILALETALAADGLVGRVLAFSGRFVQPLAAPARAAPRHTTIHLLHGGADAVMAAEHAQLALQWLAALGGDATLDIAEGIGHDIHPALVRRLLYRLRHHIPARTWAAALGQGTEADR